MKAIIFDAFGTLFQVTAGGSARTIMKNIAACGGIVDEKQFLEEWKAYYKNHTSDSCEFMTERDIFISRIQMFYDRYQVKRSAKEDADSLLAGAYERDAYPEVKSVLDELMEKYQVFIGSNTDNDVLESVMQKNRIQVHKVYTSENLKCYKPSAQFYRQILDDNGLKPCDVLFVGDSVTDDVLGPKAIGMKTVWLDRNGMGGRFGQDDTITDLNGLVKESEEVHVVSRTEITELTVLCLLHQNGKYLLQDRVKKDWQGFTLPGGHVEPGESIVDAVIREMKEETGLTIKNPRLCGVKHFPINDGRYIVFLFEASQYEGTLCSSEEGRMQWVKTDELDKVNLVDDFHDLIDVMLGENLSEFQYVVEGDQWNIVKK